MFPVVYAVECRKNGFTYVGLSSDYRRRWREHRSELRRGVHNAANMIADWRKHGESVFAVRVLEVLQHDANPQDARAAELRRQAHFKPRFDSSAAVGGAVAPGADATLDDGTDEARDRAGGTALERRARKGRAGEQPQAAPPQGARGGFSIGTFARRYEPTAGGPERSRRTGRAR